MLLFDQIEEDETDGECPCCGGDGRDGGDGGALCRLCNGVGSLAGETYRQRQRRAQRAAEQEATS